MSEPVIVDRVETPRGELVLRRVGDDFEVISNGVFLMDTRNGESERLLVRAALERTAGPVDLLIGGLGIGFSLAAALLCDRVRRITVVEIEATLLGWHRAHLPAFTAGALDDARVEVVIEDVVSYLGSHDDRHDAMCLDIDNGPEWTVTDSNAALYSNEGTRLMVSRLRPTGVLTVWGAARSTAYEVVLAAHFASVEVLEIAVPRGEPDVVLAGTRPHRVPR